MGLSRRKFTQELKEAAIRRLELGASVAEVARACEVNPNVLHRWRRELCWLAQVSRAGFYRWPKPPCSAGSC
jgi:Transposase